MYIARIFFLNRNRFLLLLAIFATVFLAILYFFWYWISPLSDAYETGRFLFRVFLSVTAIWIIFRGKLALLIGSVWVLCLAISILYYAIFVSKILDDVEYEGVHYYITYSQEPFDGWQDYHITARKGLFDYDSHGLGHVASGARLKLKYDTTFGKITVIETEWLDSREIIFEIEEKNPLFFEALVDQDSYTYYLFSSCRQMHVDCQNRIYYLYKCNLDNAGCKRLPFMYDGELGGYSANLISREETSEIEVYLGLYFDEEKDTNTGLIYSYGHQPHCYVQDCYIPSIP